MCYKHLAINWWKFWQKSLEPNLPKAARSIHTVLRPPNFTCILQAKNSKLQLTDSESAAGMKFKSAKHLYDKLQVTELVVQEPSFLGLHRLFDVYTIICKLADRSWKALLGVNTCLSSWHPQKGTASVPLLWVAGHGCCPSFSVARAAL